MLQKSQIILLVVFSAGACRPAHDISFNSLVGAKSLPKPEVLSHEMIYISRGYRLTQDGPLSFTLRPDNVLTIAAERADRTVKQKEDFHLPAEAANRVRQALWRVRPEKLRGSEWETLPTNCPEQPSDAGNDIAVAFIAPGTQARPEENEAEAFTLPLRAYCHSSQANEARALLRSVLRSFPQSRVVTAFERRTKLTPL